jgi:hypothetical protein
MIKHLRNGDIFMVDNIIQGRILLGQRSSSQPGVFPEADGHTITTLKELLEKNSCLTSISPF